MKLSLTAAILFLLSISTITHASKPPKQLLTDAQSDPNTLQLIVGFPPPIDKRVTLPDSNFFSFPKLRWSVCHMCELLPTASIARNLYAFTPLKYALLPGIDELTFNPSNSNKRMTW